jgi:hypothetical protein
MVAQVQWLGQATSPQVADVAAWEAYVRAIRDDMSGAWSRAAQARGALQQIRERLGLPFMVEAGETTARLGAWDAGLEQNFVELGSMVATLSRFADQSLAGQRRLGADDSGVFGFEQLPGDATRVEVQMLNGRPRPVEIDNATNQPVMVTGTVGAFPPILIGIAVVAAALTVYLVVTQVCETVENVAQTKQAETLANAQTEQIKRGATPEQAKALTESILKGQASVSEARAAETAARRQLPALPAGLTTLGFIALGIAGIWLVSRFIGRGGAGAPAMARMLGNPVRRSGDARVRINYRDEFDDYAGVITWPGGRWHFDQLRASPHWQRTHAVDSSVTYDEMARSALSFGSNEREEIFNFADYDFDRDTFIVKRR